MAACKLHRFPPTLKGLRAIGADRARDCAVKIKLASGLQKQARLSLVSNRCRHLGAIHMT